MLFVVGLGFGGRAMAADGYVEVTEIWAPDWSGRWRSVQRTNEAWAELPEPRTLWRGYRFPQRTQVVVERARVAFRIVSGEDGSQDWVAMLEGSIATPESSGVVQKVGYLFYRVAGPFFVDSATALAASSRTRYSVLVAPDGTTTVIAEEHTVDVQADGAPDGAARLHPGSLAVVTGGTVEVRPPTHEELRAERLPLREMDLLPMMSLGVLVGAGGHGQGRGRLDLDPETSFVLLARLAVPGPLQVVATFGRVDTPDTTVFPLDVGIAYELGPIDLGLQTTAATGVGSCETHGQPPVLLGATASIGVRVPVARMWDLEGRVQVSATRAVGHAWTDASVGRVSTGVSRRF